MIRELTKSALSFSWAVSLLGVKQAANLTRPGQNGNGDLFAPMTQTAVGQLDESMKGIYRSGDNLGSRAIDLAFCWLNPLNWLNPSSWTNVSSWANPANWMRSAANFTSGNAGCGAQTAGGQQQQPPGSNPPNTGGVPSSGPIADWGAMPENQS
jgi:hypothetical protein